MVIPLAEFQARARAISVLVMDVDGVLTDGSVWLDERGRELKRFHIADGFAIKCWQRAGHRAAILSGRFSQAVAVRCRELGIERVIQGSPDKIPPFRALLAEWGVDPGQVCYIGDDLPDLPLVIASGVGATVADAAAELRARADWVASVPGGQGAARELIVALLAAQGRWAEVVDHYSRPVGAAASR